MDSRRHRVCDYVITLLQRLYCSLCNLIKAGAKWRSSVILCNTLSSYNTFC